MGHPVVDNPTPLEFAPVFTADENGRPALVAVLKATYEIGAGGRLTLAAQQRPVCLAGERHDGGSWKYEPEATPAKSATDVVLIGSARPPRGLARELPVRFRVGPVAQDAVVVGDRTWTKRFGGGIVPSEATPFESMPLTWERAFGGWDRNGTDPAAHSCEERNPLGRGYRRGRGSFEDGIPLPNVESPGDRLRSFGDRPAPVGFGFTSPEFHPRRTLAGTYDDAWQRERRPLLPLDFDRRFFNAAAPGLITSVHLQGDEPIEVTHCGPTAEMSFRLPRVPPPVVTVVTGGPDRRLDTRLDTVIVNADEAVLLLLWRGAAPDAVEPHRVRAISIAVDGIPVHTR
jgi:hypothetical protein